MIISQLSETEATSISKKLDDLKVKHRVGMDQGVHTINAKSLANDLRHYHPPDISTDLLAIEIDDSELSQLTPEASDFLKQYGHATAVPTEADFNAPTRKRKETLNEKIVSGILFVMVIAVVVVVVKTMFFRN